MKRLEARDSLKAESIGNWVFGGGTEDSIMQSPDKISNSSAGEK
jgi:hypothetical protein